MSAPLVAVNPSGSVCGREVLTSVGAWLGGTAVLGGLGYWATSEITSPQHQTPTLTAVLLAYLLFPIAALAVFTAPGLRDRLAVRRPGTRGYRLAALVWIGSTVGIGGGYLLVGAISGHVGAPLAGVVHHASDYSRFPAASTLDWALIIPRVFLLAGVTEELLFRGLLYGWLRSHLTWWATALITAVLFAAIHFYPVLIPVGFLLGLALAWLREHTGSVLPGLVVHILTDALLFFAALALWSH